MSPDLDTRIRTYGDQLDRRAASLETLAQRAVSTSQPPTTPRPRWALTTGAAAVLVVAVGGVAVLTGLFSGGVGAPVATAPDVAPVTLQDGTWQRTVLPAGLYVEDVEATSFGLVAAATMEGIWISPDGLEWQQVFVGPQEPFKGTTTTLAPPMTSPPPPGNVETYIRHIAEYEGALYAVGTNVTGINGPDMTGRMIVYRSGDGRIWEATVIEETGRSLQGIQPIEFFATGDGLILIAEGVSSATSVYRSADGRTWTELDPDATGLGSVGLFHGVTAYSAGFLAVVDASVSDDEPVEAIYRSADGMHWEPVAGATFGRDDYSDIEPGPLAEYANAVFLGGFDMVWETGHRAALWRSSDGVSFNRIDLSPDLPSINLISDLVSTPNGLLVVGWSWPTDTEPSRLVLLTTSDGVTFIPVTDDVGAFDNVQEQRGGLVFGNSVLLFGMSDQAADFPPAYQWTWTPEG